MDQFVSGDCKSLMKSIMKEWEEKRKSNIKKFVEDLDRERLKKESIL